VSEMQAAHLAALRAASATEPEVVNAARILAYAEGVDFNNSGCLRAARVVVGASRLYAQLQNEQNERKELA
jgi:hypothetical protein